MHNNINKREFYKYYHCVLDSLTEEKRLKKTFSDLSKEYMALSVQYTVACYERGAAQDWRTTNIIRMLSQLIINPATRENYVTLKSCVRTAKKCQ